MTLAGAATGAAFAAAGAGLRVLWPDAALPLAAALGAVALAYALHELDLVRLRVPGRDWQVPASWVRNGFYRSAAVFGATVGMGVFTRVPYATFPVLLAWLVVSGNVMYGAAARRLDLQQRPGPQGRGPRLAQPAPDGAGALPAPDRGRRPRAVRRFPPRRPLPRLAAGAILFAMTPRLLPALCCAVLALAALAVACNDDDGDGGGATPSPPPATATVDLDSTQLPAEEGEEPVFWRTTDSFASLRAGEPYKVLFRVTSGYSEPTLTINATREDGANAVSFESNRVDPVGDEGPGAFYPVTIELPEEGAWIITLAPGDQQITIPVQVAPAEG
jgi:hypothetical protein